MLADATQPSSPASACSNGSFVTLITGARYAAAAACLPRQLAMVGSACNMSLVYDDTDAAMPVSMLQKAYGSDNMFAISALKARYFEWLNGTKTKTDTHPHQHAKHGRRLYEGQETHNTHDKLWIFALPMKLAVFLDIDMLILREVDSLLSMEEQIPPDGIGACTCKSKYGARYFNSGLLVFRPSFKMLQRLLAIDRWASSPWNGHIPHANEKWPDICAPADDPTAHHRMFPNATSSLHECRNKYGPGRQPGMMAKACESKLTDQSIFNHVYTSHAAVNGLYNDAHHYMLDRSHIVHFVGEPKPWNTRGYNPKHNVNEQRWNATKEWQLRCAPDLKTTKQ